MARAEVVFIATPALGNMIPIVEFAQRLIDRDRRFSATILIITHPQRPIVSKYIDSRASSSSAVRFVHLPPVDPPEMDHYESSIAFLSLFIEKHKPHVKRALTTLNSSESRAESVHLTGLVVDMFSTAIIDVADELGVPSYLYFASPAGFLGLMLHLPTLDAQFTTDFEDSASGLIIPSFENPVPPLVLPSSVLKRKRDAYRWLLFHARRYTETKGIIVNSFQELEPYAFQSLFSCQRPQVYPVGPMLDLPGPTQQHFNRAQHETIMKWLDNQPPGSVVLLCFGSMGSLDPAQVREIALGLEQVGCRFLWSLRRPATNRLGMPSDYMDLQEMLPDGFLGRTAEVGLVCGWAPQVAILGHEAVVGFVSHCGWNSIMESLWYGVPIATWPIYAEQQMNAFEMVKELKLAVEIRLDYGNGGDLVSAEEVARGVRRLLDPACEVRKNVKEMREKCRTAVMEGGSSVKWLGLLAEELLDNI